MKTPTCLACLLVLVIVVMITKRMEGFGMSSGTLDQLRSTSTNMPMPVPGSRPYFLL